MLRKLGFILLISPALFAQADPTGSMGGPSVVTKMLVIAGLSLLPFMIMLLTSFVKIIIVLSLLRNAIGVQQTPPNQVINGIALLLTLYVMFPTGMAMYEIAQDTIKKSPVTIFSEQTPTYLIDVVNKSKEPLRGFLERNTVAKHMRSFYLLAQKSFPEPFKSSLKENDFIGWAQ